MPLSPEFQQFMDSFAEESAPLEAFYQGQGGVFVPLIGLMSDQDSMSFHGGSVVRLNYQTWQLTEKLRYRDIFGDYYAAFPRYYFVYSVSAPKDDFHVTQVQEQAYEAAARFVLALRLLHEGLIVEPRRLCAVYNSGGTNHRTAGSVYRMYTWAPQGDIYIPSKTRKFGDDEVFMTQSFNQLPRKGYFLSNGNLEQLQQIYKLVTLTDPEQASSLMGTVLRTFSASQDIWLTEPERVISLCVAFETLIGGLKKERINVVFNLICILLQPSDRGKELRQHLNQFKRIRDAYCHGEQNHQALNYEAIEFAEKVLRESFVLALKIDAAYQVRQAQALAFPVESTRDPISVLRQLLNSAAGGKRDSQNTLELLRNWSL